MISINLLPWRTAAKVKKIKKFRNEILEIIILGIVIIFSWHQIELHKFTKKNALEAQLQLELDRLLQVEKKQDGQLAKLKVLQKHQNDIAEIIKKQNINANLMIALSQAIPKNIYLSELQKEGEIIVIKGFATSYSEISLMLNNFVKTKDIKYAHIIEIKQVNQTGKVLLNEFSLELQL